MDLKTYQTKALETAQPEAFSLDYLIPGIVGEVGELFGQKAKAHWHGWSATRLQAELVSEFGDICWMTAILLDKHGVHHVNVESGRMLLVGHTRWGNKPNPWHMLLNRSRSLHQWYSEKETHQYIRDEALMLWTELANLCTPLIGVSFEHVLQNNLNKLADRAARGTLVGQGDHR